MLVNIKAFLALIVISSLLAGAPARPGPAAGGGAHSTALAPQPAQPVPGAVLRNVTYCNAGDIPLAMDVYFPRRIEPGALYPAILYVHGGAWVGGSKSEGTLFSEALSSAGYLVASIDYRLAPQHRWPAQIEDVKCAVRHLRARAADYRLDPNRIAAMGSSAGGHLAALAGLAGKEAGLEGSGGYPEQSSAVQAVIDFFGPADLTAADDPRYPMAVQMIEMLVGGSRASTAEKLRQASPVTYVSPQAPPFFIVHGDKDNVVPLAQSQLLNDRLTAAGASSTLVIVKNMGHGFVPSGGAMQPGVAEVVRAFTGFLDAALGPSARTFPQTGKAVSGLFLRYWQENGGLAQQGYPISGELKETSEVDGKTYTVQYFERAVFESHPENAGKPSEVLLSLLGSFRYKEKYPQGAPGQMPNTSPGSILFKETGKRLGGRFLDYWQANGGLAQQGYPISDEFTEVSELDGKPYLVQYFERAVFEHHPANASPSDVLLSQLGTFRFNQKYRTGNGGTP